MNEAVYDSIGKNFKTIRLGIDVAEFARFAEEEAFTEAQMLPSLILISS